MWWPLQPARRDRLNMVINTPHFIARFYHVFVKISELLHIKNQFRNFSKGVLIFVTGFSSYQANLNAFKQKIKLKAKAARMDLV